MRFPRPSTKYFPGQVPSISQAKYQAKVDELAKMRRSVSPDPAKVNRVRHFKTGQREPNLLIKNILDSFSLFLKY